MSVFLKFFSLLVLLGVSAAAPAFAENGVELEFTHSSLTSGYSTWNDVNTRTYLFSESNNQFIFEADYKNHFDQSAGVLGVNYTRTYDANWYQDFSATAGTNTEILPGLVLFSEIHRKFLENHNLVLGFGVGYNLDKSPYTDQNALIDAVFYLGENWVIQGGIRENRSSPGPVWTARFYGASTYYVTKLVEATLKFESGREGYTVVGANDFKNEFYSSELTAQLRYWLRSDLAIKGGVALYENDFYRRNSYSISLFKNF